MIIGTTLHGSIIKWQGGRSSRFIESEFGSSKGCQQLTTQLGNQTWGSQVLKVKGLYIDTSS